MTDNQEALREAAPDLLLVCEQAVQLVAAWGNGHPNQDGNCSRIAARLVRRMNAAIDKARGR